MQVCGGMVWLRGEMMVHRSSIFVYSILSIVAIVCSSSTYSSSSSSSSST